MYTKEQWTKPQLIVLARGTPEEAVLEVCKQQTREYPDPQSGTVMVNQTMCNTGPKDDGKDLTCGSCQGVTGS